MSGEREGSVCESAFNWTLFDWLCPLLRWLYAARCPLGNGVGCVCGGGA